MTTPSTQRPSRFELLQAQAARHGYSLHRNDHAGSKRYALRDQNGNFVLEVKRLLVVSLFLREISCL